MPTDRPDQNLDSAMTDAPSSLSENEITKTRVSRRSFLAKTVAAGSIGIGASLTAACPSGTDTDGGADSAESDSSDSDGSAESDSSDSDSDSH